MKRCAVPEGEGQDPGTGVASVNGCEPMVFACAVASISHPSKQARRCGLVLPRGLSS